MTSKFTIFILILIPVVLILLLNESIRHLSPDIQSERKEKGQINSSQKSTKDCTWACHNDTNHCKENHVKILQPYFKYTDPLYFGIIRSLNSTGDYALANIIFLVLLIPLLILFLLAKILAMQREIHQLKSKS